MIFFSLLCALLLEQLPPLLATDQLWYAQQRMTDWAQDHLDADRPVYGWIAWIVAAVIPAGCVYFIYLVLSLIGWPLALACNVWILSLTLDFRSFNNYLPAICEALERKDDANAWQLLKQWKTAQGVAALTSRDNSKQIMEYAILNVHQHLFGTAAVFAIFSIFGLGPTGAVLYRCADFTARRWLQRHERTGTATTSHSLQAAQQAWYWIDWLPTRITATCFAIVGNFEQAVNNWRQVNAFSHAHARNRSETILLAVTAGALDVPDQFELQESGYAPPIRGKAITKASASSVTQDPTFFEENDKEHVTSALARHPEIAQLQRLSRLIWRGILLWGLLIALMTVTHWIG